MKYLNIRNCTATLCLSILTIISSETAFGQSSATVAKPPTRVMGYTSFILPLVKVNKDGFVKGLYDFHNGFSIGFPTGVNLLFGDRHGFSFEITPTIKAVNGVVKTSNLQFAPGLMLRYPHGFTFFSRLAFETAGRFGVTPVFNKMVHHSRNFHYFVAGSLPIRLGNGEPASIGVNLQMGMAFN